MTTKPTYRKKSQIEHVLTRPDMYVGSVRMRKSDEYIAIRNKDTDTFEIIRKPILYSPALLRIFIEALSNAIDNVSRSLNTNTPCKKINITIDYESGKTSIWNDGCIIPVEIHPEEKCYNHSLIFGQLLTGSSYNDEEERKIAGRNGIGIKVTSIFSTFFEVEGYDPDNKLLFRQRWLNNMREPYEPEIRRKTLKKKKGYTQVTWTPDFKRFGIKKYSKDIINLYTRHVIDCAMLSNVRVSLNGSVIPIKSLTQYSKLYNLPTKESILIKTDTSEVLVSTSSNDFQTISFVNGIYTKNGGNHVNSWCESIFRPIVNKLNKKKGPKINISDVKQFFTLIIKSTVNRPEFDSQEKNRLDSPDVVATVSKSNISSILKWSVIEKLKEIIKQKELNILKKVERKTNSVKVDGLDPANKSGTKFSSDCCLFICEGLSAKTYVVAGIQKGIYGKKGRDWNGILPVTGKLLNVRNATPSQIAKNKVIISIIQSLGLKQGVDYTIDSNYKSLRYGKVILIADADDDGIHIECLVLNMFHCLFPSLLSRKIPFVVSMKTPIAKILYKSKANKVFYDERKFTKYMKANHSKSLNIKYYKGLGTTKASDVADSFGEKMIEFEEDIDTSINMNKIFHKTCSDKRKKWLETYNPEEITFSLDNQSKQSKMNISDFLNFEMIKFSYSDCGRSIPNAIDGLKTSQRKILFSVFKRKLNFSGKSLKVAQLSGYVAEKSLYHHGEQNLQETIINLASNYVGSNNINLLFPDGAFGSRLENGKDSASARYIYTKLESLTKYIFKEDDMNILNYMLEDGEFVQPEYYVPILPMILINGCTGIGTGYSCNIPCFNPLDIIRCVESYIENEGEIIIDDPDTNEKVSLLPQIKPWYRNFNGKIYEDTTNRNRYITEGIIKQSKSRSSVEIVELPIGMSTSKFKEICDKLVSQKQLKKVKNYSTTNTVRFVLTCDSNFKPSIKSLKLTSYLYTSNMVLFDENSTIKKYDSIEEIIETFCNTRLKYYQKRKKYLMENIKQELSFLTNKEKFILEIINKTLKIMNTKEKIILDELDRKKYIKIDNSYNYLLNLNVRNFTYEKVEQIKDKISQLKNQYRILKKISCFSIWKKELNEFQTHYSSRDI